MYRIMMITCTLIFGLQRSIKASFPKPCPFSEMPSSIQRNETGLAPPSPHWILRHHAPSAIHTLSFALGNSIVAAGDAEGRVSLTGTRDYRPRAFWQAHKEPVLSVEVWKGRVIS